MTKRPRKQQLAGPQPRPVLAQLPQYRAGKAAAAQPGLTQYKLSSNENPLGPVPAVKKILENFDQIHRYPDPNSSSLRQGLSQHLGLPVEDIVTGAGSLGALTQILAAFAGTNPDGSKDQVIYPWRSFEAYPICVGLAGAQSIQIPNKADGSHNLAGIAAAVTSKTKIILLCSPNNPTGPALTTQEVRSFLASIPSNILVILDEAYYEFCLASPLEAAEEAPVDGLKLYRNYPNLILLRTFSKAQGLAGLRVGYSISTPAITQHLRTTATPFAVTALAQEAALASIKEHRAVMSRVEELVAERQKMQAALAELGWWTPASKANFIWLALGQHTAAFMQEAENQALALRGFDQEGVRVSIGEKEANKRLLSICQQFPHPPTGSTEATT